jgi:lon-related putative ATP-dependent protease
LHGILGRGKVSNLQDKIKELQPKDLTRRINLGKLKFRTTEDLETLGGVIEQERAMEAIELGLRIKKRNFNIYVAGASGTGKSSIVKDVLTRVAKQEEVPPDWCMVHNFKYPDRPVVFSLKPSEARKLKEQMDALVEDLKVEVQKAFHGKVHQERIQRILNDGLEMENRAFMELTQQAQDVGFLIKSTKDGLVTIPLLEGKPVGPKEYQEITNHERQEIETRRQRLEPLVSSFLERTREIELQVHKRIQEAQKNLGMSVVQKRLATVRKLFADCPAVQSYLDSVEAHMVENIVRFLPEENGGKRKGKGDDMTEYKVNVLIDNSDLCGAPVVIEQVPTYYNLIGKFERKVEHGVYYTDFTMVKAGALLRANGGYLVLHARDVLTYPFAWDALKQVLRNQKLVIEEMGEPFQFLPTSALRPDPIPVTCKVVLIGSNYLYHVLCSLDEDFKKTFQVKAEFDSSVPITLETTTEYARFIATTCKKDNLLPVDRKGVETAIAYGARLAGSKKKMTLRFNEILNLLIEADALARMEGASCISKRHIEEAQERRYRRISLLADLTIEDIVDKTINVEVTGKEVGVVNGIAVHQFADLVFGRPLRISARTFQGKAGIVNVEREARLSGSVFNKAVLIIQGFLGERFAQKNPLSLTANLVVEQSYGTIEGDSASCAEVCAIISSLSGVPFRQDIAVTGSINQLGEVQAVGAINEKIEGFFRVCQKKGLTGTQGVVIPEACAKDLMLARDVVNAVRAKRFHIYSAKRIEEVIALLSGMEVGGMSEDGFYPEGTVFGLCLQKVKRFAEAAEKAKA